MLRWFKVGLAILLVVAMTPALQAQAQTNAD
jgi:hypothetical protein